MIALKEIKKKKNPQVKRYANITYQHGIYMFFYNELPNDSRKRLNPME